MHPKNWEGHKEQEKREGNGTKRNSPNLPDLPRQSHGYPDFVQSTRLDDWLRREFSKLCAH